LGEEAEEEGGGEEGGEERDGAADFRWGNCHPGPSKKHAKA
jgi:hypothetical protein